MQTTKHIDDIIKQGFSSEQAEQFTEALNRMQIEFYSPKEVPYGCFSNFYMCHIVIDGVVWPSSEHYYQAVKTTDPVIREKMRKMKTCREVADYGRSLKLRDHWDLLKVIFMKSVLLAKFRQHESLKEILLGTGDKLIVEKSMVDSIWGIGKDGKGQNLLGKCLMEVRDLLRKQNA